MADVPQSAASGDSDLRFAHYRILRQPDGSIWELGRGAMGVTYKAFDEQLRIEVALKVITPGKADDAKAQALFLREARAAARVRHPNVASVVYLNTAPGNFFYAMEFIDGESLADWLRTRGAMPLGMAVGFATQTARGLSAIHQQHIVHRDLKPANIMIVPVGSERSRAGAEADPEAWQIKIIDFGLARGFSGEGLGTEVNAQTIGFRGTAIYASPEQCEERGELDGRSDLYSLGCILWEMLVGTPPFRARTHRELLNLHVSQAAPMERLAFLPAGVQAVVARLLAKDPTDRFADAESVVKALERCNERVASVGEPTGGIGETTRDVEPAGRTGPVPSTIEKPSSRSRMVGTIIAGAIMMILGVAWFATRGQRSPPSADGIPPASNVVVATPVASPASAPAVHSRKSIAVLPFENLSGRPEDVYLADGLQEEILNALARVRDLKVISRTSVKEFRGKDLNIREIGQRLGVGTIVEGSIRRDGSTVRLTIQVIDARDDHHLLATSFDRELNKVLDLQSTVARQVAESLTATFTRQERGEFDRVATNSGDAYDRYLHAVALYRRPAPDDEFGLNASKRLLEEALGFDANYADAYALLSQVNTWETFHGTGPEDGLPAKQAFERAFSLDPQLPEAQLARGLYAIYVSKNLDQALADLRAVVKVRPNSAEAHFVLGVALRRNGRMEEALGHLEQASELDPLNELYADGPMVTLIGLRRIPEGIAHLDVRLARFPGNPNASFARARLEARRRNSSEPLRALLRDHGHEFDADRRWIIELVTARFEGRYLDMIRLINESPGDEPDDDPFERALRLGCLYLAAGDASRADENIRRAETLALAQNQGAPRRVQLPLLATLQSLLGKHEEALATVDGLRARTPETRDAINGPQISFMRSVILVRAGRTEEGYAEVARLLYVPFGSPLDSPGPINPIALTVRDDPKFDELINHPPRL